MTIDTDFLLQSYSFDLPESLIAQEPSQVRDNSKLLVYDKECDCITHAIFSNISEYLPCSSEGKKALLVANNSKVVPARLFGKSPYGGKRELLLITPPIFLQNEADSKQVSHAEGFALLKPSKNAKVGDIWTFNDTLHVEILEKFPFGKNRVRFSWNGNLLDFLNNYGHLPLPPYIKREKNSENDKNRYQTIYADSTKSGSVAAPTAGLHFTQDLKHSLLTQGFLWEEVSLHVGYGTFTPVRCEDIREHPMHSEYFELSAQTAQAIIKAKQEQRPIVAVGTTSCRVLEGAAKIWNKRDGSILPQKGLIGETDIFIHPQSETKINVIDGIITNFHLPQSSLLMLVSAIVGREKILDIYSDAIQNNFRFFSYGDAMLIK